MRLTRPSPGALLAVGLVACAVLILAAEPSLARSSIGIGTAESATAPSGPFAALFIEINRIQRAFFTELRQALVGMKNGGGGVFLLVGVSFVYGIFHAAGPGHGKAVISSYVLANEVQLRRGILLSFVSAMLQGVTALLVVGIGWFVLRGSPVSMTDATNWLEIASFALIAGFGAVLLLRKIWRMAQRPRDVGGLRFSAAGTSMPATGLTFAAAGTPPADLPARGGMTTAGRAPPLLRSGSAAASLGGGALMRPAGGFDAAVCTDDEDCDCGRAHMPDPTALGAARLTLGSAASAVIAVGLRPCSGAIVVLTFGLLNGLYLGGVLSVFAMALGTAITVSAIAALAVYAKDVALRFGTAGGMRRTVLDAVEILGALLVLLLGLALLGGALV
jgi:nickel/cobalt transporter (NicO) family protein